MSYSYIIKSLLIGDEGVGRSSLSRRFIYRRFKTEPSRNVLVDFLAKRILLDDKEVILHIYQTVDLLLYYWKMNRIRRIMSAMVKLFVVGAILVYDTTRRETFKNLTKWLEEVREEGFSELPLVLVGNKCDLESDRAVSYDEGEDFAKKNGLCFLETSAKSGENVPEAFQKMIDLIHEKIKSGVIVTDKEFRGRLIAGFGPESHNILLQDKKKGYGFGDCNCW